MVLLTHGAAGALAGRRGGRRAALDRDRRRRASCGARARGRGRRRGTHKHFSYGRVFSVCISRSGRYSTYAFPVWPLFDISALSRSAQAAFGAGGAGSAAAVNTGRNIAAGSVLAAYCICAGLVVSSALSAPPATALGVKVADVLLWILLGSAASSAAARLVVMRWRLLSRGLDLPGEIARGNVAGGVMLGGQLLGVTLLVTGAIAKSGSVVTLAVWLPVGLAALVVMQARARSHQTPPARARCDPPPRLRRPSQIGCCCRERSSSRRCSCGRTGARARCWVA